MLGIAQTSSRHPFCWFPAKRSLVGVIRTPVDRVVGVRAGFSILPVSDAQVETNQPRRDTLRPFSRLPPLTMSPCPPKPNTALTGRCTATLVRRVTMRGSCDVAHGKRERCDGGNENRSSDLLFGLSRALGRAPGRSRVRRERHRSLNGPGRLANEPYGLSGE